jgi:hypothetical protein
MKSVTIAILLAVALLGLGLLSGCGSGDTPSPPTSTLSPTAAGGASGPPGKGGQGGPSATTVSPQAGASTTPAATATPGGGGSGATITDESIRANILRRLAESPALTGLRFKVRVTDGEVYLFGKVKTKAQKQTAEQIAVTEPGIKKVVSYVFVVTEGDGGY